ncbi:hypothetical protein ACU4GG_08020 [Streptomyces nojiriensis]
MDCGAANARFRVTRQLREGESCALLDLVSDSRFQRRQVVRPPPDAAARTLTPTRRRPGHRGVSGTPRQAGR